MVRDDDAVGAARGSLHRIVGVQDAFDDKRPRPEIAQSAQVIPIERIVAAEEACPLTSRVVLRPGGRRREMDIGKARQPPLCEDVAGERTKQPARMTKSVDRTPQRNPRREVGAVTDIESRLL